MNIALLSVSILFLNIFILSSEIAVEIITGERERRWGRRRVLCGREVYKYIESV